MKIFSEKRFWDFENETKLKIEKKINGLAKNYILNVNEEEYIQSLQIEYELIPLKLFLENIEILEPKRKNIKYQDRYNQRTYDREIYEFSVYIPFEGSEELFSLKASSWVMTTYEVEIYGNKIFAIFELYNADPKEFERTKNDTIRAISANVENVNKDLKNYNYTISTLIRQKFIQRKNEFLKENDFFKAINLTVNSNADNVFNVNPVVKKKIPIPTLNSINTKFSAEPTFDNETYQDILKVINSYYKSFERKPSTYKEKGEVELRDFLLSVLETRYDNSTATSETFNKSGKTDILLKHIDNSNLFVAECKIWSGKKDYFSAIDQLLSYLTWRDTKTALILFVQNQDFSNTLKIIETQTNEYKYFDKFVKKSDETSFSFIFKLPTDLEKKIFVEVLAFHFVK